VPVRIRQFRWSPIRGGTLNAWWVAALVVLALPGCAQNTEPVEGSETHFLRACDVSCASGLECVDGQCSLQCSVDEPCSALNASATCEQQPSGVNACEVSCSSDAACTSIRPELSCNNGVCRGPLWQLNADQDAHVGNDSSESTAPNGDAGDNNDSGIDCSRLFACPMPGKMYFSLPQEGLGTVRLEFSLRVGDGVGRCAAEFEEDEMVSSDCDSWNIAPTYSEECPHPDRCPYGSLSLDVRTEQVEVTYWQSGYQTITPEVTVIEQVFSPPPLECKLAPCRIWNGYVQLPSTKGPAACLSPLPVCEFGLGCGNLETALADVDSHCEQANTSVFRGEGCGYDILVYQQYIEGSRAFYDRETGELVGHWQRSDTSSVQCYGEVPSDCAESADDLVNLCATPDAGSDDALPEADAE
jgi:hypothetical protein